MHLNEISINQNDYKFLKDNIKWLEMAEKDYMQLMPQQTAIKIKDIYEKYTKDYSHSISCAKCLLTMTKTLSVLFRQKQEEYRQNDQRNKNKNKE